MRTAPFLRAPISLVLFSFLFFFFAGCAGSGGDREPALAPSPPAASPGEAPPEIPGTASGAISGATPGATPGAAPGTPVADTVAVFGDAPDGNVAAGPDTLAAGPADSLGIDPDSGLVTILEEGGNWVLDGDELSAASTDSGQVIRIRSPVITHGDLRVTARRGLYVTDRDVARLYTDVTFIHPDFQGKSEIASYYRNREMLHAQGNVEVEQDSLRMRGDHGYYYQGRESFLLRENVMGWKGTRYMEAREAEWFRDKNEVLLWGGVVVVDTEEETRLSGNRITYDLNRDLAYVTEQPGLTLNPGKSGETNIRAENLWVNPDGSSRARGNVVILRGAVTATSDSAAFYRDRHLAVLLGNPQVRERDGTMTGDTLFLHFDEDEVVDQVKVHGNAAIRFAPKDSVRLGERSTVQGDSLTMFFEDDQADRVLVFGQARSTYRPALSDKSSGAGTNAVRGDSITVYLDEGKVSRVRVRGNAKGVYSFVSETSDTTAMATDTLVALSDTLGTFSDTTGVGPLETFGPDAADRIDETVPGKERVIYAADEVLYTLDEKTVDLLGNTNLDYGALNLTAGKVRFYADRRYLDAEDKPVLVERQGADTKEVVGSRMDYNMETREGTILGGRTKAEDGFIYADKLRQIGDREFIARDGNFTTCDEAAEGDDPHFHFTSNRMRIYLKDKVVAKPVTLYIRDIPIFALPFYVFSINKGRQSGFLVPDLDFGITGSSGRYFRNLGYYWAASEYYDVAMSAQYTEATSRFVADFRANYAKRYLMEGSATIRRSFGGDNPGEYDIVGNHRMTLGEWSIRGKAAFRNQGFRLQDPLSDNFTERLDRLLESDISASRNFPFGASLYLTFDRNEDIATDLRDGDDEEVLRETLPQYSFNLNSRTVGRLPDENGEGGRLPGLASLRWSFSSQGSSVRTERERTTYPDSAGADTTFALLRDRSTRATHRFGLGDTRKILGALNVSPSISATEHWVDREFSAADTVKEFRRAATWTSSMGVNTKLYGTFPGLGLVEAVRHTFVPLASFNYQPEFSGLTYADTAGNRRNRFPGVSATERKNLSLSLDNSFQAKLGGEESRKVDLFRWSLSSSYDLLRAQRGQHGWSPVQSSVNLSQLSRIGLTFDSSHDPYRQFRLTYFNVTGNYGFSGTLPGGESAPAVGQRTGIEEDDSEASAAGPSGPESGSGGLNWRAGFGLSYGGSRDGLGVLKPRAQIDSRFSVQITKNWAITYDSKWDSSEGKILYETLGLKRDLHCWEAQFSRTRYGSDTSFYFRINVKQLSDVKYEQGQQGGSGFSSLTGFLP